MYSKSDIRKEALAARDQLDLRWRIEASLAMADKASDVDVFPDDVISGFWPIRSEVDIRPLMFALGMAGNRLALPVVVNRETIVFRQLLRGAELVDTGFGTVGPGPDADVVDPSLILMPLAAFDGQGNRVGYGAGHYDRAIAALKAKGLKPRLYGVAFECQRVEKIPAEPHDEPLDAIITETGVQIFA